MKKRYLALLVLFLSSLTLVKAQYCTPTANCSVGDGVTLMSIGPFSNSSGCESDLGVAGYADFTDVPGLMLGQGVTYEGMFLSGFSSQQFSIWIDADNSETFETSELIMTDLAVGTDIVTTDVTIPADLALGEYRLRVKANYFASSSEDACLSTTYGECEDYTLTVTEPPTCINVSGLQTTVLSATSATIAWTDPGTGSIWDIEWGVAGFTPTGIPSPGYDNVDNPAVIDGLNPVTEYDVYIRADCGEDNETDVSVWTSGFSFITACGAVIPTYIEDFNDGLGACWETFGDGDLTTGPLDGEFSNWFNDGFANTPNIFQGSQGNYVGDIGILDWLVSPDVDLSADGGPYQLEFDFSMTAAFSQDSVYLDENDEARLVISTDFGATWSTMEIWDDEGAVEPTGEHFIYDLTPYDGEIARFAIWITSGADGEFNAFEVFFDNFIVQPLGSPMNVQIDQVIDADCFFFGNPLADVLISISGGVYPYTFDWSNGTTNEDLIDAEAGIYTLTVTDAEGTEYISDPIDVPGTPTVNVTAVITDESFSGYSDGSIDITSIEGSSGPYSYYWNNGTTEEDVDGLFDALWCLQITDGEGCQTDTCFLILPGGPPPPPDAVSEFEDALGLTLYPNPSVNGVSYIKADLSSGTEWNLQVIDAMGRIIRNEALYKVGIIDQMLDLSDQSSGVYTVRMIRKDDGKETSRVLLR